MMKPPVYRIFGTAGNYTKLLVQVRHPETRVLIDSEDLLCFSALVKIPTPWGFDLRPGSRLFLTSDAARFLIAAGSVAPLEEVVMIPWKDREAASQGKISRG